MHRFPAQSTGGLAGVTGLVGYLDAWYLLGGPPVPGTVRRVWKTRPPAVSLPALRGRCCHHPRRERRNHAQGSGQGRGAAAGRCPLTPAQCPLVPRAPSCTTPPSALSPLCPHFPGSICWGGGRAGGVGWENRAGLSEAVLPPAPCPAEAGGPVRWCRPSES